MGFEEKPDKIKSAIRKGNKEAQRIMGRAGGLATARKNDIEATKKDLEAEIRELEEYERKVSANEHIIDPDGNDLDPDLEN